MPPLKPAHAVIMMPDSGLETSRFRIVEVLDKLGGKITYESRRHIA